MALLAVNGLSKSFGAETLFENLNVELHPGDRIGVTGPNGCGKSTLFRMLAGVEQADHGTIARARGLATGWLRQDPEFTQGASAVSAVLEAFAHLDEAELELRAVEEELASAPEPERMEELVQELQRLSTLLEAGAGNRDGRARETLAHLGLKTSLHDAPCATLSGGERCRVALARLLLEGADLLLLDEPTNHLDLDGIEWLEEHLARHKGALFVISHDRRFLDEVTTATLTFTTEGPVLYRAPWSRAEVLRKEELEARRRDVKKQQHFIAREEEFIRRHLGSQRSAEAKGRRKRLERLERLSLPSAMTERMHLDMTPLRRAGEAPLRMEGLSVGHEGRYLVRGLECTLEPGERVGIVGRNGCGKSTLLNVIAGKLPALEGRVDPGRSLEIGFYSQSQVHLPQDKIVREFIHDMRPRWTDFQVRSLLARFLFFEEDTERPISQLSGGERGRLALAELLLNRPNMRLLDEPTNHLDIPAREALEELLAEFTGTLLVVSHDRHFLDRMTKRTLWIDADGVRLHESSFSEAHAARRRAEAQRREQQKEPVAGKNTLPPAPRKSAPRPKRRALERIEADIMQREAERTLLHEQLSNPDFLRQKDEVRRVQTRLVEIASELQQLEVEWSAYGEP
jgi:ATP-binding cassette subfamily F protein 3